MPLVVNTLRRVVVYFVSSGHRIDFMLCEDLVCVLLPVVDGKQLAGSVSYFTKIII